MSSSSVFAYPELCVLDAAGIYNCGNTIIKEEGVRSLWKGLTPFAMHLTLKYALRMGTNAFYQSLLRDQARTSAAWAQSLSLVLTAEVPTICNPPL